MNNNQARHSTAAQEREEEEVFQSLYHLMGGGFVVLRDGRVSGFAQPEPAFMQRRYEHARALRELQRESRMKEALEGESRGFVERIRVALGMA
jgi:hypothetical protein